MFRKLAIKDRHTDCEYCNYTGCTWSIAKHGPTLGHWMFVLDLGFDKIKNILNLKRQYKRLKRRLTALDYSQIEHIEMDGIDTRDYPDFCDAFISSAIYKGRDMTDKELDRLNEDSDYIYYCVQKTLY